MNEERARDGRPVETVGFYNPLTNPSTITLQRERIDYWIGKGAQPSDTVRGLIKFAPVEPAAPAAHQATPMAFDPPPVAA